MTSREHPTATITTPNSTPGQSGRFGSESVAAFVGMRTPHLMWGTDGVRVFTVDDGWGWIFTAVEHWNAECVGWHGCKAATASPPCSRSPWGLPGCMARPRPARLGGWPCWITAPSICRTTSPTRSSSGASSRPTLRRRAPDQRRRRGFNRTLKEQIIHGRIYRNIADRDASATSSNSTMPSGSKERLPEPRSSSSGVARRDLNQCPPRETNLCPRNRVRYSGCPITFIAARYDGSRRRDDRSRPAITLDRAFQKPECSPAIPPFRGKNLKHFAFVVNSAPQIVGLPVDPHEHLIKVPAPVRITMTMPGASGSRRPADRSGSTRTYRLVADVNATLGQQVLDQPQRQRGTEHTSSSASRMISGELLKYRKGFCIPKR